MVEIKIPHREVKRTEEVRDISRGELVLAIHQRGGKRKYAHPNTLVLGVFDREGASTTGYPTIVLSPSYQIFPDETLGKQRFPIISPRAPKGKIDSICLSAIREMYVGLNEISQRLRIEDMTAAADLIERMQKPYL